MMTRIERGEANGIIAWHPDRLARNSVDGGRVIYLVDTEQIAFYAFRHFGLSQLRKGNSCCRWRSDRVSITAIISLRISIVVSAKKSGEASGWCALPLAMSIIRKREILNLIRLNLASW